MEDRTAFYSTKEISQAVVAIIHGTSPLVHVTLIRLVSVRYAVGSKSSRPDIQKPCQMENAVRDI